MATNNIFYDKDFRSKLRSLDEDSLKQLMVSISSDAQIKVLTNSKSTIYFVMPDVAALDTAGLFDVQAAGKVGTAGSVGTASTGGTVGTICGTGSSLFSFGTLGCTGTADPSG